MKITPRKYAQALALMLGASEKAIIGNFLEVLRRRKQLKLLPKILAAFEDEWLKHRGYTRVEVRYPKKFESSLTNLEKRLQEKLGEKLSVKTVQSERLIGGLQVKIGDTLIDASVENNLRLLAKRINKS